MTLEERFRGSRWGKGEERNVLMPRWGRVLPGGQHPIPDGDLRGSGRIARTAPGSQPWP